MLIIIMGNYRLKKLSRTIKILLVIIMSCFLIIPGVFGTNYLSKHNNYSEQKVLSKVSKQIEIPYGSDYYIKFDSEKLELEGQEIESYTNGLSEKVISAIAKSPKWIQRELSRQFHVLNNSEVYADLILDVSKQYVDEIAFSIACSPLGKVPSAEVIYDNVLFLYENDHWISYADIVDYDDNDGNYYSTVKYKVLEDEIEKEFEYPKEIYYWYIVHPEISSEDGSYVYDMFWREYLFYHNDLGYPLLKEKLSTIDYLWDCKSYTQHGNRLWKWSMENHPTAIEAISYWIGKTVPYEAMGDRPGQPNIIAHEHNGYCGELQRIAVAAQRACLVASIGVCNIAEDHVWREFYERGWHQNDNWWTDSGGVVDNRDMYQYGWGKYMSAVYAWNGDDSIDDLTSAYIHPEDRTTVKFVVKDSFLQPADGARVTATVVGLKDISWIKYTIFEKMQQVWDILPEIFKGKIIQAIYDKIYEKVESVPDVIDGLTISTWNYTDTNGECSFDLGKNHEYLFVIQQGNNIRKPWQLAKNNAIRVYNNTKDRTFHISFIDFSNRVPRQGITEIPEGDCIFDISFETRAYQLQKNVRTDLVGTNNVNGVIDFFILDEENFGKYQSGRRFTCYNYINEEDADFNLYAEKKDWYIVFRNHAKRTSVIVDFSLQVEASTDIDMVQIVSPDTSIFDTQMFSVGDEITIDGVATDDITLSLNGEQIDISTVDGEWIFLWNTSNLLPADYIINAECFLANDIIIITLIDEIVPEIVIDTPLYGEIVESDMLTISGQSLDNQGIEKVEIAIDESEFFEATGTESWSIEWDSSSLELGDHIIYGKALDLSGNEAIYHTPFVINESGHDWGPYIHDFYHIPESPINTSNVIIYANVTMESPFAIKSVFLYYSNGTDIKSYNMYEYANNPIQDRHEEDPLIDEPNDPIYGFELGQFEIGQEMIYWIVAYDSANNSIISNEKSFMIN